MRTQFIRLGTEIVNAEDQVIGNVCNVDFDEPQVQFSRGTRSMMPLTEIAPWAAKIVSVDGGWQAFESQADYDTWASQT